jgi:hypothetical protein
VSDGTWEAHGDVRVFVSGTADVHAYGRSRVWASGNAYVFCADQARVAGADDVSGHVYDRGTAVLVGSSSMGLHGEAPMADIHGRSRVWMGGRARVDASGHADVAFTPATGDRTRVLLRGRAQHADRPPRTAAIRRLP